MKLQFDNLVDSILKESDYMDFKSDVLDRHLKGRNDVDKMSGEDLIDDYVREYRNSPQKFDDVISDITGEENFSDYLKRNEILKNIIIDYLKKHITPEQIERLRNNTKEQDYPIER